MIKHLIPFFALCIFIATNAVGQPHYAPNGPIVIKHGKDLIKVRIAVDTFYKMDPKTGAWRSKVLPADSIPTHLNGSKIYSGIGAPRVAGHFEQLSQYLSIRLQPELQQLQSIGYEILLYNVVIGHDGHIVYYKLDLPRKYRFADRTLDNNSAKTITKRVTELLANVSMGTPTFNGQPVPVLIRYVLGNRDF